MSRVFLHRRPFCVAASCRFADLAPAPRLRRSGVRRSVRRGRVFRLPARPLTAGRPDRPLAWESRRAAVRRPASGPSRRPFRPPEDRSTNVRRRSTRKFHFQDMRCTEIFNVRTSGGHRPCSTCVVRICVVRPRADSARHRADRGATVPPQRVSRWRGMEDRAGGVCGRISRTARAGLRGCPPAAGRGRGSSSGSWRGWRRGSVRRVPVADWRRGWG